MTLDHKTSLIYMAITIICFLMPKMIRIIGNDRVPLRKFAYVKYKHFKTSFLISNVHCTSFRQLQKHLNIYFLMLRLQISKISFSAKYCLILSTHQFKAYLFSYSIVLFNRWCSDLNLLKWTLMTSFVVDGDNWISWMTRVYIFQFLLTFTFKNTSKTSLKQEKMVNLCSPFIVSHNILKTSPITLSSSS